MTAPLQAIRASFPQSSSRRLLLRHGRAFATKTHISLSSSPWSHLSARPPPPGTGFDNFLIKKRKGDNSNSNNGESRDQGGGSGGNKNDNRNNNDNLLWFAAAASALGLAGYLSSSSDRDSTGGGDSDRASSSHLDSGSPSPHRLRGEISWGDFLTLLQQRDVVKILINGDGGGGGGGSATSSSENLTARVYLRANAIGLAPSYEARRRGSSGSSEATDPDEADLLRQMGSDGSAASSTSSTVVSGASLSPGAASLSPLFYRLPIGSVDSFERKLEDAQRAMHRDPSQDVPVQYAPDTTLGREILSVLPGLFIAAALYGMMRFSAGGIGGFPGARGGGGGGMGGIFQIGKSTHKKIAKEDVKVRFKDVAGCDEAKKEIMEFVDFLKDSDRFTKLGAKIPKGALLCGPPGTGKTLLAKAVAGEAGVPFYSISGSDFIEMFVGVGPSRVRDLFQEARANAPCIVFIDEIDAVGRQRGRGGMGGNDERENTLNQLLVEMDGFQPSTGVVVLAGTNRVDILDQALTRPGRFDRQITVDKPDLQGRKAIFKVHLEGIKLEDDVDDIAGRLAGLTPGFAGADIANICNEAAIVAARRKGETVTLADFEKATDRIIGGLESNKIMSKEERSIVAHHEAGHAIAGWFLEHADPLLKVTIIPRSSGALGFAQYLPKEVFLRTKDQIMDIVCMALAGRASEEIFFGRVTTGASDDLKRVTQLVYSMIQLYGMNPRLGQLSFPRDPNAFFEERPYSEKTAKAMDEEARAMVEGAYQRTLNLLREKQREVEVVANLLLEKETITHTDVIELIGPRPFKGDPAYDEYVQRKSSLPKDAGDEGATETPAASDPAREDLGPLNPGLA